MPSTANASNSITPQFQAAIGKIKLRAKEIIKTEPENTWRPLLRNVAAQEGVDLDIKDLDLESFLDEAERSLDPSRVYHKGDKLQATESVFMLDGLIKLGEANVVIGQPKVGKSSFSTGLIAALRDKREQFLGRDLLLPETRMPVLIFGARTVSLAAAGDVYSTGLYALSAYAVGALSLAPFATAAALRISNE